MEDQIIRLFECNDKLRFRDIEKYLKVRSNKLDYHLKKLVEKEVLIKNNQYYSLSEKSEYTIPYLSPKSAILPVLVIHIGDNNKAFLIKRVKRPYKNKLSLPGGRMIVGESLQNSVKRIMKKYNIKATLERIHSVSLEHVKKSREIVYSFFLIFVSAKTRDSLVLTDFKKKQLQIISSDLYLLTHSLDQTIKIPTIWSKEK